MTDDPHGDQSVVTRGASLDAADAAVVLVHGRGATAESMLQFAAEFDRPDVAYLAPQAARNAWYPQSFMAPISDNQPWLDSALGFLDGVVERAASAVAADRVVVVGFSQGGCLGSEFVARNSRRYGGLAALSGGLIGPEGTEFAYDGSLDGTPVFLGCSDRDPHIPVERVHETADAFEALGGQVDERIYEGMGHGVNRDELDAVADLLDGVLDG
jgi:predicted esterase